MSGIATLTLLSEVLVSACSMAAFQARIAVARGWDLYLDQPALHDWYPKRSHQMRHEIRVVLEHDARAMGGVPASPGRSR